MIKYIFCTLILHFISPCIIEAEETVFCLHGFMRTSRCMKKMGGAFRNEGYETNLWGYPSRDKYIEEHAKQLVIDLNKTASEHPGESIHFVTHSLGGIILRAALNLEGCPNEAKIGRAVLLSPPNQGSCFAKSLGKSIVMRKVLGDKAGKQLYVSENFEHLGQFPKTMKVQIISGTLGYNPFISEPNDGKVGVSEACLSTEHSHITFSCGHSWIMQSRKVINSSVSFIGSQL